MSSDFETRTFADKEYHEDSFHLRFNAKNNSPNHQLWHRQKHIKCLLWSMKFNVCSKEVYRLSSLDYPSLDPYKNCKYLHKIHNFKYLVNSYVTNS